MVAVVTTVKKPSVQMGKTTMKMATPIAMTAIVVQTMRAAMPPTVKMAEVVITIPKSNVPTV